MRQLQLEGIGLDGAGRMARIPTVNADEIPHVYVARHAEGSTRLYRCDLPELLLECLDRLDDETLFEDRARVRHLLAEHVTCSDVWAGSSYVVADPPLAEWSPDVSRLGEADRTLLRGLDPGLLVIGRPVYAVVVEGHVASTCVSVRQNPSAAEAWVQTAPDFRRRGYARQVTAAWARDVRSSGKIAFYSHAWENVASLGVARSLGMTKFIDAVGYL